MNLLSLGKEPISPDKPTGSDVRYEPEFEQLQAEIDKLSSPSASETMDWSKVEKLASEILAKKAKDLLVASYLAVAQIHTNQVEGFATGLGIYRDLLEHFWEDLFPTKKRMRGRIAAVEWWLEKSDAALASLKVSPLPAERVEAFRQDIQQIDTLLREYLEESPLLRPLERFLESVPIQVEKKGAAETPSAQEKAPAAPRSDPSPQTTAPAAPEEIASAADAEKVLDAAIGSIRRAGAYLLGENLANAQGYRWRRIASWALVEAVPPATDGQTIVPPPDPGIRNLLEELREKGNWEALAESAEQQVSEFIFWFDLNRFVAEALAGLGDRYQDAHEALCQETAVFAHRLAGVERLSFSDGTPFADADTQQWLKGIRLGAGAGIAEPVVGGGSEGGGDMAEAIEKAQGLAKKKKLAEAVSLLQKGLHGSFPRMEQLLWRLGLSQLLLNAKKPQLALPHLESILQDIDTFRLEQWDPDLALKGLKMIWIGFGARSDEAGKEQATGILNRIAKLSPAEALQLDK